MTIEAKIFDITIHEKIAEVVVRKKKKDKIKETNISNKSYMIKVGIYNIHNIDLY